MSLSVWLTFFLAAWAISVSPGAGAIAAMSAGLNHGFKRGYFMTVGLIAGIWTQVAVVSLGLGALIAASSLAFSAIKWLGVAYLLWLGVKQWRARATPLVVASSGQADVRRRQLIVKGWMVNAVNPKGTVFLLAVVPQFLDLSHPLKPDPLLAVDEPYGEAPTPAAASPSPAPTPSAPPTPVRRPRATAPVVA